MKLSVEQTGSTGVTDGVGVGVITGVGFGFL